MLFISPSFLFLPFMLTLKDLLNHLGFLGVKVSMKGRKRKDGEMKSKDLNKTKECKVDDVFPLSDADFNKMMMEETANGQTRKHELDQYLQPDIKTQKFTV